MASTITLQQVADYARTQTSLLPIVGVGGFTQEPALSFCNDVLQEMLSAPYNWRFNRASIQPFTTVQYQQDYALTNAVATVTTPLPSQAVNVGIGNVHIQTQANNGATQSGTTVTIVTCWPHGFSQGQSVTIAGVVVVGYNGTFTITGTPTTTSFTYTTGGGLTPSGGPGIANINWIERCVLEDFQSTSPLKPNHEIEVVANLPKESIIQPPFKVAHQYDTQDTNGLTIPTFRMWPVPSSQIWNAYTDYQQRGPLLTDMSNTWTPIPDELAYVYRQGFLAKAFTHAEDPRGVVEQQKFIMYLAKALNIKDYEIQHQSFFPTRAVMIGG